jgi:hypothetical protein
MENQHLPDCIAGIPTAKNALQERRDFVSNQYKLLLGRLMNKTKKKVIHNDFLDVDVHLIYGEGGKEATNRGVFNWQSAYAILKLETIVKKQLQRRVFPFIFLQKQQEIRKITSM